MPKRKHLFFSGYAIRKAKAIRATRKTKAAWIHWLTWKRTLAQNIMLDMESLRHLNWKSWQSCPSILRLFPPGNLMEILGWRPGTRVTQLANKNASMRRLLRSWLEEPVGESIVLVHVHYVLFEAGFQVRWIKVGPFLNGEKYTNNLHS